MRTVKIERRAHWDVVLCPCGFYAKAASRTGLEKAALHNSAEHEGRYFYAEVTDDA